VRKVAAGDPPRETGTVPWELRRGRKGVTGTPKGKEEKGIQESKEGGARSSRE
jgi:hypothetical protein